MQGPMQSSPGGRRLQRVGGINAPEARASSWNELSDAASWLTDAVEFDVEGAQLDAADKLERSATWWRRGEDGAALAACIEEAELRAEVTTSMFASTGQGPRSICEPCCAATGGATRKKTVRTCRINKRNSVRK